MEKPALTAKMCNTRVFWGEVAPCDQVVQIYKNDEILLDALEEFAICGINSNDCVIIIGTVNHLKSIEQKLQSRGMNVDALADDDQLILLNAETTLAKLMRNDEPDKALFNRFVNGLIAKANIKNREVRAFGEMVAILWDQGHSEAAIQLERLWNNFCKTEAFCLFCACPKSSLTKDLASPINILYQTPAQVLHECSKPGTEVCYTTRQISIVF